MRLTDVAAAVPVFLLWIACAPPTDRATTNDGDTCAQDAECDSRICEVDKVCRGSNCEKDDGCRDGWTCLRKTGFLGSTTGTCVPGCDRCPIGRACQNGGTECLTVPITLDMTIVEPPAEQRLLLKVGAPVKLRADVKVTPEEKAVKVIWQVYDVERAPSSPARYEGSEATHTFTMPGKYYVDVTAIAGQQSIQRDASLDVK
jgi:hypothetical protein